MAMRNISKVNLVQKHTVDIVGIKKKVNFNVKMKKKGQTVGGGKTFFVRCQ